MFMGKWRSHSRSGVSLLRKKGTLMHADTSSFEGMRAFILVYSFQDVEVLYPGGVERSNAKAPLQESLLLNGEASTIFPLVDHQSLA